MSNLHVFTWEGGLLNPQFELTRCNRNFKSSSSMLNSSQNDIFAVQTYSKPVPSDEHLSIELSRKSSQICFVRWNLALALWSLASFQIRFALFWGFKFFEQPFTRSLRSSFFFFKTSVWNSIVLLQSKLVLKKWSTCFYLRVGWISFFKLTCNHDFRRKFK